MAQLAGQTISSACTDTKRYLACRIPLSTCHSQIGKWCGNKPRVLVLNRVDMISERDKASWTRHFNAAGTHVCWTDGVSGLGTGQVSTSLLRQVASLLPRAPSQLGAIGRTIQVWDLLQGMAVCVPVGGHVLLVQLLHACMHA